MWVELPIFSLGTQTYRAVMAQQAQQQVAQPKFGNWKNWKLGKNEFEISQQWQVISTWIQMQVVNDHQDLLMIHLVDHQWPSMIIINDHQWPSMMINDHQEYQWSSRLNLSYLSNGNWYQRESKCRLSMIIKTCCWFILLIINDHQVILQVILHVVSGTNFWNSYLSNHSR